MKIEGIKNTKCQNCEYSMDNNRCPLKEQRPDNSYCDYFIEKER